MRLKSGSGFLVALLCVSLFAVSSGFLPGSCHNRTRPRSRNTRSTDSPVPIECKLKSWTAWIPCTSCTETTVRFQSVERHSQFGGTPCVHSQWDKKQCPNQGKCVPRNECGKLYSCPETGRCISKDLLCNRDWDCQFGNDEENCKDTDDPETKCSDILVIPGAQKAIQGYNALTGIFVDPVLDPTYFGGRCEYIYNGEWRELTYDSFCEHLSYSDDAKYFRKPYNFLSYRLKAHTLSQGSSETYNDAVSLLRARKTEDSFKASPTIGIMSVEFGLSGGYEETVIRNISQYDSKNVEFVRLLSTVETAQFKIRTRDLMLHEDMLRSLLELPERYDFGAYSRFINTYGTHYVTQGIMGGVLDYVVVVNEAVMKRSRLEGKDLNKCFGVSLGISDTITEGVEGSLTLKHESCGRHGGFTGQTDKHDDLIQDVIGYVKGGITDRSAAQLAIKDAESYRKWGRSLKYNPDVIKFEGLPIYELVRLSTAATQASTRLPFLKQAWEEYLQQFNPCHCAPCRNNGIPVLSGTSCSCLCREGYGGLACEKTERKTAVPIHGAWSCWGSWSSCVSGTKTRNRECNNPAPKDNGFPCRGNSVQKRRC